jgi:hypothetical protein
MEQRAAELEAEVGKWFEQVCPRPRAEVLSHPRVRAGMAQSSGPVRAGLPRKPRHQVQTPPRRSTASAPCSSAGDAKHCYVALCQAVGARPVHLALGHSRCRFEEQGRLRAGLQCPDRGSQPT